MVVQTKLFHLGHLIHDKDNGMIPAHEPPQRSGLNSKGLKYFEALSSHDDKKEAESAADEQIKEYYEKIEKDFLELGLVLPSRNTKWFYLPALAVALAGVVYLCFWRFCRPG